MELLITKNKKKKRTNSLKTLKFAFRVDEMTSFDSEGMGLILLTLNRSKIADHRVHLLLEGKTKDAGF